jgi:hypothetical protein
MISTIYKSFTGKQILILNPHRNSTPLVNRETKQHYTFLNPHYIWKASALFGRRTKLRYRVMAGILSLIDPAAIIDINWTDKRHSLYLAWCKRNGKKFVVIQHGIYHAGIIEDVREKYVKCTTFLVWGEHFRQMRERDNNGKNCEFIVYGNPVYNSFDRDSFSYKEAGGDNILVAVSVIEGDRLRKLTAFLEKLEDSGFHVTVKEHSLQAAKAEPIDGFNKSTENLYDLLKEQRFDYVVTDVSSAMTDIIFFKNRAIYFSPDGGRKSHTENVYGQYLVNIAKREPFFTDRNDLLDQVSIETQEKMLAYLIKTEGTKNTFEGIL